MKIGSIVEVFDDSWSMALTEGKLRHMNGNSLRHRRFRVLTVSGIYPIDGPYDDWDRGRNDILLLDIKDPSFVLFTQERFCRVVSPAPPAEEYGTKYRVEIPIPPDAKRMIVSFLV
jgi:hypothetical protein